MIYEMHDDTPRLGPTSDQLASESTLALKKSIDSHHRLTLLSWTEELLFPPPLCTLCVDPSGHCCLILCHLTIQAVAELVLGAILQVVLEKLASRVLLNFERHEAIETRLNNWKEELIEIKQALGDAEDKLLEDEIRGKQETNESRVKSWVKNVTNLAYDIEDLLDEFAIESAQNESESEPGTTKVRSLLPSCCFRLSPRKFMVNDEMRSKMEEMDERLKKITVEKDRLSLKKNPRATANLPTANSQEKNPRATSNVTEPCFVSREDEKRKILQLLIGEEDERTCIDLKVIPTIAIVGLGGIGKTALAQQIYNDAGVKDYFDVKAWACVSDSFNISVITKSILMATSNPLPCQNMDLNCLQDKLKEYLTGKKFLVVFDDIWNDNPGDWDQLLKPFQFGAKGSKIILTTRYHRVAEIAHAQSYELEQLSQDDCMTLLTFHALRERNFDHHPEFKDLGIEIVNKCGGLPLAVKTLAGALRTKKSWQEWKEVLDNKIWDLPQAPNDVSPALKLSYLHLPSNLRRCFAYCAIFPKDHIIERDELIHWWIGEGLLDGKERKSPWNTGLEFFNELVARSLLQKSSNSESQFLMHDLVNDLAKLVAGAIYFSSVMPESPGDQNDASLARHASFIPSYWITSQRLKIYHGMKGLRSFVSLKKQSWYGKSSLPDEVLCDLLLRLRYLRVLSLTQYSIDEVPDCIGKMRHLRHLNLSYTNINTLPKSIVILYNLEALMLRGCQNLVELPKDIEKLINLRFLDIADTSSLRAMPLHIGSLVGLEMLTKFVVGTENGSRLKELKNLKNLGGELCISDLHKVQEAEDATVANLCTKEGICRLTMEWCDDFKISRDEKLEEEVLGYLRPHKNLENLDISYYGGLEFPSWLGNPSYINVVHLRLHGCCRAKMIPPLGRLSNLKELSIEGLNAICKIGSEFYGTNSPFPSLITLEFRNMLVWKDWSHCAGDEEGGVVFPRLERLLIQDCPMLIGRLPSQLSSLVKLQIESCPRMNASPSIISLPSLEELDFGGCNEGMLKSLVNLTSLIAVAIRDVAELTCLNHEFTSSLIKLEKLEMARCNELQYLWRDRDDIRNLACLKELVIDDCPELISFAAGEGDIELPGNLETMHLSDCLNLEKLPSKMHALSSLGDLSVDNCPKLVSFPETGIPRTVASLRIENCEMLQSLPIGLSTHPNESSSSSRHSDSDMSSSLQKLIIYSCGCLGASPFSEGRFLPATLKRLEISGCNGVESLAEINADCLHSLQEIKIGDCENLRSLPKGLHTLTNLTSLILEGCPALELECLPPLPPSITSIELTGCPKIKSLPNQLHRLTCLRDLEIRGCESIARFPDGGLPPQLRRLIVMECGNMKQPVREWLTPRLTSLVGLYIDGRAGGVGEGVDLVLPLPPSLLSLSIKNMGKVERVASSLPPSLRRLWFSNCPKLRELPRDGLPPSLEAFVIYGGSGVLEERCRKGTGRYWPLLREIPYVYLGD